MMMSLVSRFVFFFNDTATTEIYTLSLHDALPIFDMVVLDPPKFAPTAAQARNAARAYKDINLLALKRSEEHTSELQSQSNLVCRLLLEKKKRQPHQSYRELFPPCGTAYVLRRTHP